jgi:hypothetical protein
MGEKELKGEEEEIENEQQRINSWEEILGKVLKTHYVHSQNTKLITCQIRISKRD